MIKTFTVKTRYTERKLNSNEKNVICWGVKQMRQLLENYKKYKNSIKWKMVNLNWSVEGIPKYFVGNKAKGWISKLVFQENKRTCPYQEVRNFRFLENSEIFSFFLKIWKFSWNIRFKIRPFVLLPTTSCFCHPI